MIYGDTDSVFVHLKGRSIRDAFEIGKEIAAAVTKTYPYPIELKFEKVYTSLILASKKRYVGVKLEKPTDVTPVLEAKGIETVRRDGCDAVKDIMTKSLEILFSSKDLSVLKAYLTK